MSVLDSNGTTQSETTTDAGSANAEPVSRRDVLRSGAAAVAVGITALTTGTAAAQTAGAPAILTGTQTGRRFRGYARFEDTGSRVIDVTMLPLDDDRVVVRTEATPLCYTMVQQALYPGNRTTVANFGAAPGVGRILGHGGVGVVEAVGARVRRVQVGDRVVVHNTPYCGQCYNCVRGRTDRCQMLPGGGAPGYRVGGPYSLLPIGTLTDGTPIVMHNNEGGVSELMIPYEWYCMPIFNNVSSVDLSAIVCSGSTGLGCAFGVAPIEPASDVAVFGCGPLGIGAVQGARIKGASQIIAIEPIAYRRDIALRVGATIALNPNDYRQPAGSTGPDPLVAKIRELCSFGTGPVDRRMAAQRLQSAAGPDFIIEAVGGDQMVPSAGTGPDPSGMLPLQQAWTLNTSAGHLCTTGVAQTGNFTVPGAQWSNGAKNHHPGNMNGCNTLRDSQRFARLIETGQFNAKAMVSATVPLDGVRDGFEKVGNRAEIGVSMVIGG